MTSPRFSCFCRDWACILSPIGSFQIIRHCKIPCISCTDIFTKLITKTYLYNFDPLKPHFYIVILGFTGVYIIFLISTGNIDCGYSLEPPRRGGSNEYPQSMFWTEIWKISEYHFVCKLSVFGGEIFSIYLNRRVFVMIAKVAAYRNVSRLYVAIIKRHQTP